MVPQGQPRHTTRHPIDYTVWETVGYSLATLAFVIVVLEVMWGLGWPLFGLIMLVVCYALFIAALIVAQAYDIPLSLYQAARGREPTWPATRGLAVASRRVRGVLGPPMPREIHIRAAAEISELLRLSPTGFEVAVADLLRAHGYPDMRRVGGAGDLAVDLVGLNPKGQSVAVQCKRCAPEIKVGSPEVQKFIGMTTTHHRVDQGIFVTTSSFTKPAMELAKKHKIELIDGVTLAEMLLARASADHRGRRPPHRARGPLDHSRRRLPSRGRRRSR